MALKYSSGAVESTAHQDPLSGARFGRNQEPHFLSAIFFKAGSGAYTLTRNDCENNSLRIIFRNF